MKTYTLDNLVRETLSDRGYTLHWYIQFLQYGVTGLRELNFDVLQMVKSVRLPVNSYKAVKLPCDFVDVVRLGNEAGQYVYPWLQKDTFNRLNKLDSNGNKVPYGDIQAQNGILPNNWEGFWYTNYINDKGEHLGRIFNNFSSTRESFKVLRERDEIQLDVSIVGTEVVLDYISDGLTVDSTNAIHPYATDTLKKYIVFNYKKNSRQYGLQERQLAEAEYFNALRVLRARMNSIDAEDITRVIRRSYGPTIKN
jgi:hypothetical protein